MVFVLLHLICMLMCFNSAVTFYRLKLTGWFAFAAFGVMLNAIFLSQGLTA